MKNIALVLPYDYKLLSVAAILDVFETVNLSCVQQKKEAAFRITVVQTPEQLNVFGKSFHGYPVRSLKAKLYADIVLIPSFTTTDIMRTLGENEAYLPWLRKQYQSGAEIASFCTGAYLFAASGLLNGKLATTHMDACPRFIISFPMVFVKPGRTVTIDDRCYTSGGSTSQFHLLIFLIQKYCGNETAVSISKIFAIDLDRYQQSYFSTFRPDYSHNDDLVRKIQQRIDADYLNISTIEEVIKKMPASRRNIVRRFKQATRVTPIEYLQQTRIEASKKILVQSDKNINEIVFETGYNDPKSFRKIFLKYVGMSPKEYRKKFTVM